MLKVCGSDSMASIAQKAGGVMHDAKICRLLVLWKGIRLSGNRTLHVTYDDVPVCHHEYVYIKGMSKIVTRKPI
jgi:hypothetical protein